LGEDVQESCYISVENLPRRFLDIFNRSGRLTSIFVVLNERG
jgi:hypothetical protein